MANLYNGKHFSELAPHHVRETPATDMVLYEELECGPMPNVMVTLPNIGGGLYSTPKSLADAYYMPCSNAAKIPVEICRGASNYRIDLSR